MRKFHRVTFVVLLIFILLVVGFYFYLTDFGQKGILSNDPRRPKVEVPITYNIGWWSHQNDLRIDKLEVEIIESKLSLFNSKSLISFTVTGHINGKVHWVPEVEKVHLSERLTKDTTDQYDRIIEITPIVRITKNNNVNEGVYKFAFTNEYILNSNHWGYNKIQFVCGDKEKLIIIQQTK